MNLEKGILALSIVMLAVAIPVFAEAPDDEAYRAWGKSSLRLTVPRATARTARAMDP